MKILAIETSSKVCAVALAEDDKLIKEKIADDENTHSVKLMPLVDELLKETNTQIKDIDLFACGTGPGSFTGIRIGIATIKAFLDVTNQKAVGITSLENLAYQAKEDGIICSMIDARNENVYYGFFEKKANQINQLKELQFDNINKTLEQAKLLKQPITFIGDAACHYKDLIISSLNDKAKLIQEENENKLNARNILKAAYQKKEEAVDSNHLMPVYLRISNAERQKFEK